MLLGPALVGIGSLLLALYQRSGVDPETVVGDAEKKMRLVGREARRQLEQASDAYLRDAHRASRTS